MDEQTKAFRRERRAWRKGRRRAVRPFKGLAVLTAVLTVVLVLASAAATLFYPTFNLLLGAHDYRLQHEDESAQYFTSSYESDEERLQAGADVAEEIEAEGATLLVNDNDALPLAQGSRVTLFSHSSVDPVFGGSGSAGIETSKAVSLKSGLEQAGLAVNPTMWDFYETGAGSEYTREELKISSDSSHTINEVPWDAYTDEALASVADYGDAAIAVISRTGGEGQDLPQTTGLDATEGNYLALNDTEHDMFAHLKQLKDEGDIERIVVLVNSSNAIEYDFLQEDFGIDAVLWIGGIGQTGANAVGDILAGTINPSGSLVDTFCYDNFSSPASVNGDSYVYEGVDEQGAQKWQTNYLVYQEGVYVGYRYYETRYDDVATGSGNAGDYDYDETVAFPFGYGLSYTDFALSDFHVLYDGAADVYNVAVTVTNTGEAAGKKTVQVYAQVPYTDYDRENGIEKPAVQLVGFEKTDLLEPGASETVTLTVNGADLASYDAAGAGTYILDAGDYLITAGDDAHDAANNFLAARGNTPASTEGRMDAAGDASLVFTRTVDTLDTTTYAVSAATGSAIENQFDEADLNRSSVADGQSVTYVSRADWEGTFPASPAELTLTDEMMEELVYQRYETDESAGTEMPVTGAENDIALVDMIGLEYDDPAWDEYLDQLTPREMATFCGRAFHFTQPVASAQIPGTRDENGPQGLTVALFSSDIDSTGLTSEDVMGATFNRELIGRAGEIVGEDCLAAGVSGLYGPGANIHRTPYAGRNFEYYSEDPYLSGQMAAAEVEGIQGKGVYVFMKHFALCDIENDHSGMSVWANEQTIREIYLKAFEDAFTEADAAGVMTAFTRIGCYWAGSHEGLLTGVLREEWGCRGIVISDNTGTNHAFMNPIDSILAGGDCFDAMMQGPEEKLLEYLDDPVVVSAMRKAVHHGAYTIANSSAMNGIGQDTVIVTGPAAWRTALYAATGIVAAGCIACTVVGFIRWRRYMKANPRPKRPA